MLALLGLAQCTPRAHGAPPAASTSTTEATQRTATIGGGSVEIEIDAGSFQLPRERILQWVTNSAEAVSIYYGRLPVPRVHVDVVGRGGSGIGSGTSRPLEVPTIRVELGRDSDADVLEHDWVMVHEFVHLGFPSLQRRHHWLEEGLATYVEPIARGQAGRLSVAAVWENLIPYLPQGLPQAGDQGLDRTHTWGRTYWGGALFCFLAEVEIRKRTQNRHGLQDALRAIVTSGGNIGVLWDIRRALQVGDEAVGVPVLTELYDKMREAPAPADLPALQRELGLVLRDGEVSFDDSAPLTALRKAITDKPALPARAAAQPHAGEGDAWPR